MMSIIEGTARKRNALGTKLPCFGKAVDYGETFHTFFEEEKAELLPKHIAKIARKHSKDDTCYLKNICQTKHLSIS